ncbi:MAG: phosphoribosylformylglycinamidine synthase [Francisellaceae bacterium]|nr:phosphoribosylformylglycinamidine synthase [Francisellaceae bacterium]
MQLLLGATGLEGFKLQFVQENLQKLGVELVENKYVYLADGYENLEHNLQLSVNSLLQVTTNNYQMENDEFIVLPCHGTISPWSSKTLDIFTQTQIYGITKIEQAICYKYKIYSNNFDKRALKNIIDNMTETVLFENQEINEYWQDEKELSYKEINILEQGIDIIKDINCELGLALDSDEIKLIYSYYLEQHRNPTDVELMTFAQVNSEHCRHKIFNASWVIDGQVQKHSLFDLIRLTTDERKNHVLSAYADNAAVIKGKEIDKLIKFDGKYQYEATNCDAAIKVETHNHPTAVSPFPGAATGVGGEIRDEAACGLGATPKVGLCGFSVSSLCIPDSKENYEHDIGTAPGKASMLKIMTMAPIGSARYANEFGRPNILGYFRSYCEQIDRNTYLGYHKPVMLAGGLANIKREHVNKRIAEPGDVIIILGGSGFLIGMGGGSASSKKTIEANETIDYASVQRGNPEIQRRAQEVIDSCCGMGEHSPIISIHDVGAGGLSNAIPELVYQSHCGAMINLRAIDIAHKAMTPIEIWCNESQERYVLLTKKEHLLKIDEIAKRENCPYSVVGTLTNEQKIVVEDPLFENIPLQLDLKWLFESGNEKQIEIDTNKCNRKIGCSTKPNGSDFASLAKRVLGHPTVASKKYLITIGDRSVGGLVAQDQMVGPWQVPIADCAITAHTYKDISGEAIAIGEKPNIAKYNPAASVRMAVGEAIFNLAGADIKSLEEITLSANWMVAANTEVGLYELRQAVESISKFCRELNICIPVGKDSMSMVTNWDNKKVTSPVTMVASAFTQIENIQNNITPYCGYNADNILVLVSLSKQRRLGASILDQINCSKNSDVPDVDSEKLINFFKIMQKAKQENLVEAYHDVSDGGVFSAVCEMSFAGNYGFDIDIAGNDLISLMFTEELSAIVQLKDSCFIDFQRIVDEHSLCSLKLGITNIEQKINITANNKLVFSESIIELEKIWAKTSCLMQKLRDNPESAMSEYKAIAQKNKMNKEILSKVDISIPDMKNLEIFNMKSYKPWVGVLREQGSQGNMEMAAALMEVGFRVKDIHMNDLEQNPGVFTNCNGLIACGGFSYGDVLGAGRGWANRILFNDRLRELFANFFVRDDVFSLGVCNGCQMLSQLKSIIPGAQMWPEFTENISGQYESRQVLVKINTTASILFPGMVDSVLPIVVAHGEGRTSYTRQEADNAIANNIVAMQYVDHDMVDTSAYPYNPNGSEYGVTALTSTDGRTTIMMPHPERLFLNWQYSHGNAKWGKYGPWMKMFLNAREFVS